MNTAQWVDECPKCHNRNCLTVYQVFLCAANKTIYPETKLTPDGFETDPEGEYAKYKDHSTENEKVRCDTCGEIFDLSDLTIPEVPELPPALKIAGAEFSQAELKSIPASAKEDEVSLCEYVARQWKLELTVKQATKMLDAIEKLGTN